MSHVPDSLFDHTDRFGDKLDVTRIPPGSGPGITFGATTRHGFRAAVYLTDREAAGLLRVLAGTLAPEELHPGLEVGPLTTRPQDEVSHGNC